MVTVAEPVPLLLERDAELARLNSLLEKACAGSGAVVTISGPAGIGKTQLLAAVHRIAGDQGFRSLRARGRELEADMAFSVVRQLLEQPVLSASAGERRRLLAGPARAGAGALGLAAGDSPASEFAAVHGLYWLCANLAERKPLLLTVDDLQWVDGPSLSWLAYLGPRCVESAILVVLTVREGDPRGRANSAAAAADDRSVHRMGLSALSVASVAALVRAELGPAASAGFCSACWELAGGNPLYVRELLAAARNEGLSGADGNVTALRAVASSAVGASVLGRLARLDPDAVSLAQALAVLGSQTEVAVAAELAGLEPAAAELTADRLAAAQILAPIRPLDFFHPLIGEAVYADQALGARRLAHRHAAAILDRAGVADRVAAHLLATGPTSDQWVVQRLSAAADTAWERGAAEVAASYLRRALAEPATPAERPALLRRLGVAEWATGDPAAIGHLEEALNEARDATAIAAAAGPLANAYIISDQADIAVPVLQRAVGRVRPTDPRRALRLDGAAALAGLMDDRTAAAAFRTVDRLHASLSDFADPPGRVLIVIAHAAMRRAWPPDEAVQLVERALAREPYPPRPNASASIIVTLLGLEAFGTLQRLCDDMLSAARRRSAVQELIGVASFSAWALYRRGELADAEAQARWALERATGIWAIDALAHLVETLVERDALDDAAVELRRMTPPLTSHTVVVAAYLMARGQLRMAQGKCQEALQDYLACGERCERLGIIDGLYAWRSEAAIAHALLGHEAEARELARTALEVARGFGRPRSLGVVLRAAGLVEGGDCGLGLLGEAVAVLGRSQAPVELARALTDHGAALRRAGQRTAARTQLERDSTWRITGARAASRARQGPSSSRRAPNRDATRSPAATR
jgi:tetratricopeptide (TPR) repeat protein